MANEIKVDARLTLVGYDGTPTLQVAGLLRDLSGSENFKFQKQNIGTSAEAIELGDVTTPGYILAKNLDATNYIEIRDGSGGADVVKLEAGDVALFRLATATPYAIANGAACDLLYLMAED